MDSLREPGLHVHDATALAEALAAGELSAAELMAHTYARFGSAVPLANSPAGRLADRPVASPEGAPAGLPAGLQLVGPAGADAALLRLGEVYHRATDWPSRRPPPL